MKHLAPRIQVLPTRILTVILLGLISACGGTGQDAGTAKPYSQTFQGVAVDGYVARSLVFIDYDNNGTRSPSEPMAFTDDNGYYSYNPITNTDYCATDTPETEAIYCLQSLLQIDSAVIRVDGGYDVLTGEPFVGQMSRRETITDANTVVNSVVSPLTSLFTEVNTPTQRESILTALNITESDLDVDYLNDGGNSTINASLLNKALKVHKVVTVLSDRVEDTYGEIGSTVGTPNDLTSVVYRNLANEFSDREISIDTVLTNTEILSDVILQTENDAKSIYDGKELDLPPLNPTGNAIPDYLRASQHAANVVNIIDVVMSPEDTTISQEDVTGRARAVEAFVIKTLEEGETADTSIDQAAAFFLEETSEQLVDTLVTSLSAGDADLVQLVDSDFKFGDTEEVEATAQLPQGTEAFSFLAGKSLRVSDLDLGWGPNNLKDSEVEAYFHGQGSETSGSFDACVKYIDEANVDGTLGEANTRGELISGYWSLLGAEDNNGESYSLLLTIEFLGATYQAIMKPSGMVTVGDTEVHAFRFDHGNIIKTWHSSLGLVDYETLPTSNADCEARLPSRHNLY